MEISRRHFLKSSGVVALAFAGLRNFVEDSVQAKSVKELAAETEAQLVPDFYQTIDLPPNFSYDIFSETGEVMDDGLLVPGKHDGMAAFPGADGRTILVRNHEVETSQSEYSPDSSLPASLSAPDAARAPSGKTPV